MTRIFEGGVVELRGNEGTRTDVSTITFPDVAAGTPVIPANSQGTMVLLTPPPQVGRFDRGDRLDYADGKRRNGRTLVVMSDIGPSKYKVTLQ